MPDHADSAAVAANSLPAQKPVQIFISYSHRDSVFVERLRTDIIQAGLPVWIDHKELQPGTDNWDKAIRAAIKDSYAVVYVASVTAYESDYCQSELAIARAYQRKLYPVFAQGDNFVECIPMGLTHVQFVDMRDEAGYTAGLPKLLKALGAQQTLPTVDAIPAAVPEPVIVPPGFIPINPYKGLDAFTADDRANFFGRSALVRTLVERVEHLNTERFLAIVGPSGAGKSSVVMAGLLPILHDTHPNWLILPRMVPGDLPIEALAEMLRRQSGSGAFRDYEHDLHDPDMRGLVKHIRSLTTKSSQWVVLFIDQFEELFTHVPIEREAERRQFIDLLTTAILDPKIKLMAVITMRADFIKSAMDYEGLTRLLQSHTQLLPPLSVADLREVVEEPARRQHLHFDSDLIADLVFAVRDQAGALPLLQFTLEQLYERKHNLTLTRSAYESIGGLRGALAKHAESTYAALPNDEDRRLTRDLFLRLIEPGMTEQDTTSRRAALRELIRPDPVQNEIMAKCRKAFVDARLLTTGQSGDTIELSHETLIREWLRLNEWLTNARGDIQLQKKISQDASAWLQRGQKTDNNGFLYRGTLLTDAQDWAKRSNPSTDETAFIAASVQHQQDVMAQEDRRKQELIDVTRHADMAKQGSEHAQRRATIIIAIAGIIGVLSLIAVIAALTRGAIANNQAQIAIQAQNIAQAQIMTATMAQGQAQQTVIAVNSTLIPIPQTLTHVAREIQNGDNIIVSQQLAAFANGILQQPNGGNTEAAVLLSIRALKTAYTRQADAALVQATDQLFNRGVFVGHTGPVYSVAFSPDGKTILTGSDDGTAKLWEVLTGKLLHTFTGHIDSVISVSFSPDGKMILTGGEDHSIRLWDAANGALIQTFLGHTSSINSVAFSSDGKNILTGSDDTTARLWNVSTGQQLLVLSGHEKSVTSVTFSPDGKLALTGSADKKVRLWDAVSGQLLHVFSGHSDVVTSVSFSSDGKTILTGSYDTTARLWDVSNGDLLRTFIGHADYIYSVAISQNGKTVLTGSRDQTTRLWDASSGQVIRVFKSTSNGAVNSVAFSPDGKAVLTGSGDSIIRIWDANIEQRPRVLSGHSDVITSVDFAPDGESVLTGSNDDTVRLWDVKNEQISHVFSGHTDFVTSVAVGPDGKTILTGSDDQTARLWNVADGQTIFVFSGHTDIVTSVAYAPDGKTALTGSNDKTAKLWDTSSGQLLLTFVGHTNSVTSVAYSSDSKTILTGSLDGTARLWNMSGQLLQTFYEPAQGITSVAYSPDGKTVLTGSNDKMAKLWDVTKANVLQIFSGHTDSVTSVKFSLDGKTVLTGSADKTARLWDVLSGSTLRVFSGHLDAVTSVDFSPDGKTMVTSSSDKTVRVWDTDYNDYINYVCSRIFRDFDDSERLQYNINDKEPTCPQFVSSNRLSTPAISQTITPLIDPMIGSNSSR